jgi:hypothetical protein
MREHSPMRRSAPKRMKMPERGGRRAPHGAQRLELFDLMPRAAAGTYLRL